MEQAIDMDMLHTARRNALSRGVEIGLRNAMQNVMQNRTEPQFPSARTIIHTVMDTLISQFEELFRNELQSPSELQSPKKKNRKNRKNRNVKK